MNFSGYLLESKKENKKERSGVVSRILSNLEDYGNTIKSYGSASQSAEKAAIMRTFGRAIEKIAGFANPIKRDLKMDYIPDDISIYSLRKDRSKYLDMWERQYLSKTNYNEKDFAAFYDSLEKKGKARFGKSFNIFDPKNEEQQLWSDYATGILNRYKTRID